MEGKSKDMPTEGFRSDGNDNRTAPQAGEDTPLLINVAGDGADAESSSSRAPEWTLEDQFIGLPWWRRPSIFWLLPGFFLYSLAFGGIIVPRLNLVLTLVCRKYMAEQSVLHPEFSFTPVIMFGDNPQCRVPEVQALATKFQLYTSLVSGILSAASSPKIGALSDRYGRKYLLCLCIFGGLLSEIVTILVASYPDTIHYSWLLLGYFFDGVFGTFIGGMAITHSYAADCTSPSKRAVAFGYFHACLFGGIALGPFIAAFCTKGAGGNLLTVFWLAFACHLVFLLYLALLIPESLSKKKQLAARQRHQAETASNGQSSVFQALRVANFLEPLKILYPTGPGSSSQIRANLLLLSTVNTIIFGVAMGAGPVVIYYSNYAFNWGDLETQTFVGSTNACRVMALLVFLPLLNYVFRTRYKRKVRRESGIELQTRNSGSDNLDLYTIRAALAFEILGYAGYSAARVGPLFFASGLFAAFGGIASPVLTSSLSKHVPHDRVGQLLGALGLLNALGRVVCPTIFSLIYANTVSTFPQTVFVVLCSCFAVAFVVSWFIKPHVYLPDDGFTPLNTASGDGSAGSGGNYTDNDNNDNGNDIVADEMADEEVVANR